MGESRAQLLGGHFSLMMLVEIAEGDMKSLHGELERGVEGMSTTCFDAVDPRLVEVSPKIGCECVSFALIRFANRISCSRCRFRTFTFIRLSPLSFGTFNNNINIYTTCNQLLDTLS